MQYRRFLALALLSVAGAWAGERVSAYRAQLNGPSGPVNGILVMTGNQMLFVDSEQPELSFAVPRSEVRSLTLQGDGLMSAQLAEPVTGPFGLSQTYTVRLTDPANADNVARWLGVPTNAGAVVVTNRQPRTDSAEAAAGQPVMFDVKHDDDNGRLIVSTRGLEFQDISDRTRSKSWTYAELKGVDRRNGNEIVIRPYHGDEFKLKTSTAMDDVIYSAIADRVVAARPSNVR